MTTPFKIAVLGSCVSRDLFNSRFNPDYRMFYECVLTQNQTSIISLLSNPTPYVPDLEDGLSDYVQWNVRSDLSKEFLNLLKEKQPEYLMLDFFADIHFGCIELGNNQFITNNRWMLHKTSFYKSSIQTSEFKQLSIENDTEEYITLWKNAVDRLFTFLSQEIPHCKVIVNKSRNVDSYLPKSGTGLKKLSAKIDVVKLNKLWDRLDGYICEKYDVRKIDLFHDNIVSLEEHPWGPFYVHYTMDYYSDCMNELHRIVLGDHLNGNDMCFSIVQSLRQAAREKSSTFYETKMKLMHLTGRQKELETMASKLHNERLIDTIKRKLTQRFIKSAQSTDTHYH